MQVSSRASMQVSSRALMQVSSSALMQASAVTSPLRASLACPRRRSSSWAARCRQRAPLQLLAPLRVSPHPVSRFCFGARPDAVRAWLQNMGRVEYSQGVRQAR
eukprot:3851539-Pleurochrysis_carterae.AAC.1